MATGWPKVVVLDLDGTVWTPDMYELWGGGGAPFTPHSPTELKDRAGNTVRLCGGDETRDILAMLAHAAEDGLTKVCTASTCDEPTWAKGCLQLFQYQCRKSGKTFPINQIFFHHEVWTAGDKRRHFENIKQKTGADFAEMIFFDNQHNNIETAKRMGLHAVFVPNGLHWADYLNVLPKL